MSPEMAKKREKKESPSSGAESSKLVESSK
jgi:hypothetical protein